ncbi:MAG: hypothetical protein H0T76_13200 [Nannocystis sp.]|nr:hypothetical protein [Nannocystis sp.]MBA3547437.1 hypothetical protein [Nannocystis sp.]
MSTGMKVRADLLVQWGRRIGLWTLTLTLVVSSLTYPLAGRDQALSVVLGALLGLFNLQSLARAGFRMLLAAEAEPDATAARTSRFAPLLATLRWPATALATAAVLWYMPGRPEGLVAGVLLALIGFTAAALQSARELNLPNPDDD